MKLKPPNQTLWPLLITAFLVGSLIFSGCTGGQAAVETMVIPPSSTPAAQGSPGPQAAAVVATPTRFVVTAIPPASNPSTELNCTYSPHFWKANPDRWLTDNLVIGRFTYTRSEALEILSSDRSDSTGLILKEFFAAALNILKGADPGAVELDMAGASVWLDSHPPGIEIPAADNQQGLELAVRLQAFNGGVTGPGPCTDEPPTPTPTATSTPTITLTPTRTPLVASRTPTATPTDRFRPGPQPTSPPATGEAPTKEPTSPPPTQEPQKPPTPTSAPEEIPTEAPAPTEAPP